MNDHSKNQWVIVGDGASSGNPGQGGYGTLLLVPSANSAEVFGAEVFELGGSQFPATNNQMELRSLLQGLIKIQEVLKGNFMFLKGTQIKIIMDSKYVLDGFSKSLPTWKKNQWVTSQGQPLKNLELWQALDQYKEVFESHGATFQYVLVKGHAGYELNERVDQIAATYAKNGFIKLYQGLAKDYPISVQTEGTPPVFEPVYLSLVDGAISKHKTWAECELHMKGKSGAKCKKVTNQLQEEEVIKAWRLRS